MKEAFWGVGLILIGMLGIVITQLFQNITVREDQMFYLTREVTEAAMFDAIDLSYYRTTGKIKIVEEKFVENFARRFAESTNVSVGVIIQDIIEEPPKATVKVGNHVSIFTGENVLLTQKLDGIIESKYGSDERLEIYYGDVNLDGKVNAVDALMILQYSNGRIDFNEFQKKIADVNQDGNINDDDVSEIFNIISNPNINPKLFVQEFDYVCDLLNDENCNINQQCIKDDIRFIEWGEIEDFPRAIDKLNSYTRTIKYEKCIEFKESGESTGTNFWQKIEEEVVSEHEISSGFPFFIINHTWKHNVGDKNTLTRKNFEIREQQHYTSGFRDETPPLINYRYRSHARLDNVTGTLFIVQDVNSIGSLRVRYEWSGSQSNNFDDRCSTEGKAVYLNAFEKSEISSSADYNKPRNINGLRYLHICAIDAAGNVSKESRPYVFGQYTEGDSDFEPPLIEFVHKEQTYFNQIPNLLAIITDLDSGVDVIRYGWDTSDMGIGVPGINNYSCNGGQLYSINPNISDKKINLNILNNIPNTEGPAVLHICAIDKAGNISSDSKIYIVDKTLPTNLSMTPSTKGPVAEDITITFSARDLSNINMASGISHYKYCSVEYYVTVPQFTSTCTPSANNITESSITLTQNGQHSVCFQAVDNAGNVSQRKCSEPGAFKIDKQKPTVSMNPTRQDWTSNNVKVNFSGNFGVSGRDYFLYCRTTGSSCNPNINATSVTLKNTGEHTVCVKAFDNAGNSSDVRCSTPNAYKIDKIAPNPVTFSPNSRSSWTPRVDVKITVKDTGGSGIVKVERRYKTNGSWGSWGDWNNMSTTGESSKEIDIPLTTSGQREIQVRVTDRAGNVRTSTSGVYNIDSINPSCGNWSPIRSPWKSSGSQTFSLSGSTDSGGSGINVSGGTCTTGFTNGSTCNVVISDKAGNTRTCTSPQNRVDTTRPTIGSRITCSSPSSTQLNISINHFDTGSGLSTVCHRTTLDDKAVCNEDKTSSCNNFNECNVSTTTIHSVNFSVFNRPETITINHIGIMDGAGNLKIDTSRKTCTIIYAW